MVFDLNFIQLWLMNRRCPSLWFKYPADEDGAEYVAEAIVSSGYFGTRHCVVSSKRVFGKKKAYMTARWLALKADMLRPRFIFDCGIKYAISKVDNSSEHNPPERQ